MQCRYEFGLAGMLVLWTTHDPNYVIPTWMEWESDIIEHHEMSLTSLIHRNESLNTEK
jgi:hypothetical protein